MTGKEVAQRVIEHVAKSNDCSEKRIGRYYPDIQGGWKNVPAGHAWISNFDVESLWDNKDLPNLKPQCKKIIEVLEKWLSGQTNKEICKVENKKPRVTVDLNNYYKVGDVVRLAIDGAKKDVYDDMLFRVMKVNKTKAVVAEIPCETNVDEVLQSIKYYGDLASWYRKYKKEDFNNVGLGRYDVSAKELGVCSFKGKLDDDWVDYVKVYDAEADSIVMKCYAGCNEIVIKNDKHWYD